MRDQESSMKALTLHAPWAWAIAHAHKRVENRTWKPPQWIVGQRIAIHAGRSLGDAESQEICRDKIEEVGITPPQAWPRSLIVCTAVVAGFVDDDGLNGGAHVLSAKDAAWYCGPVGWLLHDVQLVEPVVCKGALGLWDLSPSIAASISAPLSVGNAAEPDCGERSRRAARNRSRSQREPELGALPEVLFEVQVERHAVGSHIGGQQGAVVRCPHCQRSACQIGRGLYAHGLRLLRCMRSTRAANGQQAHARDVLPEWRDICGEAGSVGALERGQLAPSQTVF
ncbi:MAG TPA: hypothetical protein VMF89_35485 [Polyangiales bacterium]|nr:hypothetical protein [Polyangiales bacterium]